MRPAMNFSKNWNRKLQCSCFSTIRLFTEEKMKYYTDRLLHDFDIMLKKEEYCIAKLKEIRVLTLDEILKYGIYYLDAGLNSNAFVELMKKMYGALPEWRGLDTKFIFLIYRRGYDEPFPTKTQRGAMSDEHDNKAKRESIQITN